MSVAPPSGGLVSNSNYFLNSGGNALTGLNVEITFAEPLISSSGGLGIQLNTYAQELPNPPSTTPNWQQYVVISASGSGTLTGLIDNWMGTVPAGNDAQVINDQVQITTLPTANQIPAGATINIAPTTDSSSVVTGVTFTYTPPGGQAVSQSVTLTNLDVFNTTNPITAAYESPISALTLNIVGEFNAENGVFTSGSGTIVYTADQPLTVLSAEPSDTAFQDGTGETGNSVYGQLPVSNSNSITQTWSISSSSAPKKDATGGHGHRLPIPPSAQ